ncbi:MAG: hypothetical protein DLM72_01205 [Candidatus Nitrosopolaris wilkensis]|nr:MAG: hypothetical protein DLM72_01205 [Candidatus Nitrosopolaris wilkensis]
MSACSAPISFNSNQAYTNGQSYWRLF